MHRSVKAILTRLAADPNIDPAFVRGASLLMGEGVSKPVTPKHTPGPWTLREYKESSNPYILINSGSWDIAHSRHSARDWEEERANARLIAAAPTMLEMIRFLVDELENRDGYSPAESSCPECTLGTVPDNLNRGPCLYHQAKTLLGD